MQSIKEKTIGIDYEKEYFRLKNVEQENYELKETILNMSKIMFARDNAMEQTIKSIEQELKKLRKGNR